MTCDARHRAPQRRALSRRCLRLGDVKQERSQSTFRSALIITAAVAAAFSASSGAYAKGSHHFAIYDQNGGTIYDYGRLDGKGCVVGKEAVFDPLSGGLKVVPAANSNF
jgi:hypothetical protein